MNIYAQIFGIIAILLLINSYLNTKKKNFLFVQILSNIFFGIQYFILNATTAVLNSIIAITKTIIFYFYTKKGKNIPIRTLIIFEILIIILAITMCRDFVSLMPLLIAMLYTYGTWQNNLKITYLIGTIVASIWIIYNFIVGAYVASLGSIFELISSIVGIARVSKKNSVWQNIKHIL